jgi:class 3 adenylate cyclase
LIQSDFYNALEYGNLALGSAMLAGDAKTEASALLTLSRINTAFYDHELALEQYTRYLQIRDSLLLIQRVREEKFLLLALEGEKSEKEAEQYATSREIQEMARRELVLDTLKKRQQIEIQQKTIELQQAELTNQQLQQAKAEQARMLAEERLAAEIKDREILELKITEQLQQDSIEEIDFQRKLAESRNESLIKDNELQHQALERIRARNRFLAGIFLLSLLVLILLIIGLRYTHKTNRKLKDQRNKIQQQKEAIQSQYEIIDRERQKSDKLLLNILPEETAAELKETGRATPRHYEKVSVIFTDFVGFTNIAEKLTPEEVIIELDNCFLEFDHIADKYNLEKIKTIGDSYMCAGGIPVPNDTNPVDAVKAALEIRDFMQNLKEKKESRGEPFWQLRIGVNTGPVIAGVVGKNKFAYDIWGDAVNIASRMESSGEAGKVNISGETYNLVKDSFFCTYRGKVKAKNKGEIDMYFVDNETK